MQTLPLISASQGLITSLIKQDLICNKLVLGLSELGLDAGKYHLDLATIVLHLMGCAEPDDGVLDLYFNYMEKAATIKDVEDDRAQLEGMAQELYALLADRLNPTNTENG
jgi:hypothetical protein